MFGLKKCLGTSIHLDFIRNQYYFWILLSFCLIFVENNILMKGWSFGQNKQEENKRKTSLIV